MGVLITGELYGFGVEAFQAVTAIAMGKGAEVHRYAF